MIVPPFRSHLEPLKALTFEETPEAAQLYEVSRVTPERAVEILEDWLADELSLPPRESARIPWFDLLVTRWQGEGRLAFETAEAKLTYEDLDRLAGRRAAQWKAQGATRGARICVCRPFGVEYVLDLLAGFRMGVCMAWVPPYGEPYERAMLRAFAPDFVTAEASALQRLGPNVAAQVLQCAAEKGERAAREEAAHYERQEPCLAVLSPTAALEEFGGMPSLEPTLLDCESLQRSTARDAALVWLLRPGDALAAPGFHGAREQPGLLLSCLLSGAQFVQVSLNEVRAGSKRLKRPWRALGVREATRDAWLDAPEARPEADIWFRDLEEGGHAGDWLQFQENRKEAYCAVQMDSCLGGVVLATRRGREILDSSVRVALGVGFEVLPLEGASPEAETGLLKLAAPGQAAPYVLLSKARGERYRYLGPRGPRRSGMVYPRDVVVEAVMSLPCVIGASVVSSVRGGDRSGFSFGVIVFVRATSGWNEELGRHVLRTVEAFLRDVLAAEIRPDFVECYPLGPARGENGELNDTWVAVQRLRGAFRKKERLPIFRHLAALAAQEA